MSPVSHNSSETPSPQQTEQCKFEFSWIAAAHYATDLSIFVFRPYGKLPQVESLNLFLPPSHDDQIRKIAVTVDSQKALSELRNIYVGTNLFSVDTSNPCAVLGFLRIICKKVRDELVNFIAGACDEINFLVRMILPHSSGFRNSTNLIRLMKGVLDLQVARFCFSSTWKTATALPRNVVVQIG